MGTTSTPTKSINQTSQEGTLPWFDHALSTTWDVSLDDLRMTCQLSDSHITF